MKHKIGMRKLITVTILMFVAILLPGLIKADTTFEKNFNDSTLRVDYIFGGGPSEVSVFVDSQAKIPGWYGRSNRLGELPLLGNGQIKVVDPETNEVLYQNPFSSLFQEWLSTPEANETYRSFENTFLVPLPNREADIVLTLLDNRHEVIAETTHRYKPGDELVAKRNRRPGSSTMAYTHKGGDPKEAIDIAIIGEGYTAAEEDLFISEAKKMTDEILRYEPFASNKDKLNFVAVMTPSKESGVSVPLEGKWLDTAFGSHYSTFHSPRYLTAPKMKAMHEALTGVPYEHIIILANTDTYGGGGIYNSYMMSSTRNANSLPVVVHEFGHSFAGLGDEYFYTTEESDQYPLDIEPWEPNITTLVDFGSKWKDMLKPGTKIPTPAPDDKGTRAEKMKKKPAVTTGGPALGVYEGGGYRAKGVYRPVISCRMRDNHNPTFCPVCERAIANIIEFYTSK